MGDVRWESDQGDVMSTSTINIIQSFVAMSDVQYCHSQSMDAFVAQTSLCSFTHNLWRNPLIVEDQYSLKNFIFFSCKQKDKWVIMPSRIYNTDNGDSMTLLSPGHLSYSSVTTHCNHSIRLLYIGDPTLFSSMSNSVHPQKCPLQECMCTPQRPFELGNFNSIESNCTRHVDVLPQNQLGV